MDVGPVKAPQRSASREKYNAAITISIVDKCYEEGPTLWKSNTLGAQNLRSCTLHIPMAVERALKHEAPTNLKAKQRRQYRPARATLFLPFRSEPPLIPSTIFPQLAVRIPPSALLCSAPHCTALHCYRAPLQQALRCAANASVRSVDHSWQSRAEPWRLTCLRDQEHPRKKSTSVSSTTLELCAAAEPYRRPETIPETKGGSPRLGPSPAAPFPPVQFPRQFLFQARRRPSAHSLSPLPGNTTEQ
ncbi:hypothetical protein CCMA1212_002944 [Trichoderma ghanense]|uniref:Uncharacterized protein n=1 Tax=Trichoderma ghanense TaxID=65468 RepID=A0ABY2HAN3_9HYPO